MLHQYHKGKASTILKTLKVHPNMFGQGGQQIAMANNHQVYIKQANCMPLYLF